MKRVLPALVLVLVACHTAEDAPADAGVDAAPRVCAPMTDMGCVEIQRGELVVHRWLDDLDSLSFDDEGTLRTVVRLADLIDAEVVADPATVRYQIYGTDGFTFGGYATWTNIENGYIELGSRKVVWETSQGLPRSYRVSDAYLFVLTPAP